MNPAEHAGNLAALTGAQRKNANDLLAAVRAAHDGGLSWQAIGDALGVRKETVFRQAQAGSPVVVAAATNDPARVLSVRHADGTVTRHVGTPAARGMGIASSGAALAMDMDLFCSRCRGPHVDVTGTEERP